MTYLARYSLMMTYLARYRVGGEGWFPASVSNCQWTCLAPLYPPHANPLPAWCDRELKWQEVAAVRQDQRHVRSAQCSFLKVPPIRVWVGLAPHPRCMPSVAVESGLFMKAFLQLSLTASLGRVQMRFGGSAVPIAFKQLIRRHFWIPCENLLWLFIVWICYWEFALMQGERQQWKAIHVISVHKQTNAYIWNQAFDNLLNIIMV
jgi:hypothetical protein